MVLVDTNVIAPLYVRSARTEAVEELFARDAVWRTEPLALIELSNILITYERSRYITAATARDCLNRAAAFLQPQLFRVSHQAALEAALDYRVTAYDARFLALADQLGIRLITEDARLRAAAPALTQSLAEVLATR
jgi:predicted nucleic acid-binding protein